MNELEALNLLGVDIDMELQGVAKAVVSRKLTPVETEVATAAASQVVKKALVNRSITKGQAHIVANTKELPVETRNRINRGELTFGEGVYYVRRQIQGSGIIELFNDSLNQIVGETNLSKAKLPDLVNLALERIELNYAKSTTVTSVKKAAFDPISSTSTDVVLLNAEIEIIAGGTALVRLPVSQLQNPQQNLDGPANGYNLKAIKMIREGEKIQIRLHLPDGETLDATGGLKHFVDVTIKGAETRTR